MGEDQKNKLTLSAPDDSSSDASAIDKNKLPALSDKDNEVVIDPKQVELENIAAQTETLKNNVREGIVKPNEAFQMKMELDERYRQLTSAGDTPINQAATVSIGTVAYTNSQDIQQQPEFRGDFPIHRDNHRLEIPIGEGGSLKSHFYVAATVDRQQSPESRAADIVAGEVRGTIADGVRNTVEAATGSNIAGAVTGLATGIAATAMTPTMGEENKLTGTTYGIQIGMRF